MQIMQFASIECSMSGTITSARDNNSMIYFAFALHCIALIALHSIALIALHCIMTCLESFVGLAEINQWPLDFFTRIHVHVRDLLLRDRQRQRQTETDRQSETDRQTDTETDRETEKVRQEDSQTSRHKERQQQRQTDKHKHCYMSRPFSLFPFHDKPGLTRP